MTADHYNFGIIYCYRADQVIEEIESVCAVSEWSAWSPCSVTCGKGVKQRTRAYKNQLGRKKCNLELVVTQPCMGEKPECDDEEADIIVSSTLDLLNSVKFAD